MNARRVLIGTGLACLVAAPHAAAETRKVTKSGADSGNCVAAACLTISYAITQAGAGDTVEIGPGIYVETLTLTGSPLTLVGTGAGQFGAAPGPLDTVIAPDTTPVVAAVRPSGTVTFEKLRVTAGFLGGPAVLLDAAGSNLTFRNTIVEAATGFANGSEALLTTASGRVTIEDSVISANTNGVPAPAIRLSGPMSQARVFFARSRIVGGAFTGSTAPSSATLDSVSTAEIDATDTTFDGPIAHKKGHLLLTRSRVKSLNTGGAGLFVGGAGTTAEVNDTIVESGPPVSPCGACDDGPGAVDILAAAAGADTKFLAQGSTFILRESLNASPALKASSPALTPTAVIDLRNTVLRVEGPLAVDEAELLAVRAKVTAESSAFRTSLARALGAVPSAGSGSNIASEPQLTTALGPAAGSPLVDRGDPAFARATDLAGQPRALDGNRDCLARPDIGALELTGNAAACPTPPPPPPPPPPASRVSALGLVPASFRAATSGPPARAAASTGGARASYRLTSAARVSFSVERRLTGRRVRGRCVAQTRSNRRARACTRFVPVASSSFTRNGRARTNRFRYTGRRTRGGALAAGRYRLVARAGTSSARAAFRILAPARRRG